MLIRGETGGIPDTPRCSHDLPILEDLISIKHLIKTARLSGSCCCLSFRSSLAWIETGEQGVNFANWLLLRERQRRGGLQIRPARIRTAHLGPDEDDTTSRDHHRV